MGQIWGLGLPELGLCPGEEVGDSVVVESLVPLIPEDLCEELERERERDGKVISGQLNPDREALIFFLTFY